MRSIKIMGLTLVAAFAMSAFASAAAYASPEFLGSNGQAATGTTFKAKGGTSKFEGTITITCKENKGEGEITGAKTVGKVKLTFTGCESGSKECKSPGAKEKEIKTEALKGELGETKVGTDVGLSLEPESGKTFTSVESCTPLGIKVEVTGSVICEVKPIKKLGTIKLVCKESGGKQEIEELNGGKEDTLEGLGSVGLEMTDELTFSKEVEISG